jgi:ubiquinone/menaquinone biosynthesis C-methylase UbiE
LSEKVHNPDQQLQAEFNRWAEAGEGEKMENHHLDITNKTLRLMDLKKTDRVLDLGCGSGWASRLLAKDAGEVTGVDVSDEMVKQAEASSKNYPNVKFLWGSAQKIPCGDNSFDKMLSVESFYYYADQDAALDEIFRVMAPGGRIFILINLYRDNEYSLQWVHLLKVPVHVRSAAEYVAMFEKHGFRDAAWKQIPDDTPTPDDYKTKSFRSLDDLKAFKRVGALLLMGTKG